MRSSRGPSNVNRIVKAHSSAWRIGPYDARTVATLSSSTVVTLATMPASRARSKAFPSGVSASKMISWRRARQPLIAPDPAGHFHAHYAKRVRGERPSEEPGHQKHEEQQPKKRRCSPSWARLIAEVYEADPLVSKRCGGPLKVVAHITDTVVIHRILDHLGRSPPERPPPGVPDVVRVPVDDEGREIGASRA